MTEHTPPLTPKKLWGKYRGLVEQRIDPKRLNRLRLRINGVHAGDTPVNKLPWAKPNRDHMMQSGNMGIPPLGTWVWVEFHCGDHEYPIWSGSAPGNDTNIKGTGANAHRVWPTSQFGGKEHDQDSILRKESEDEARAEDAPNNFGYISPLQKRLELDDRKSRERIVMADALDNFIWINTEVGAISLEAACGNNNKTPKAHGFTFSTDPDNPGLNLYTFKGWHVMIRDDKHICEIYSPSGHQIRLEEPKNEDDSDSSNSINMWTKNGLMVNLNDKDHEIAIRNEGTKLILRPTSTYFGMYDHTSYIKISHDDGIVLYSDKPILQKSKKLIAIDAVDEVKLNANKIYLNCDDEPDTKPDVFFGEPSYEKPEKLESIKRACDYDYYQQPE